MRERGWGVMYGCGGNSVVQPHSMGGVMGGTWGTHSGTHTGTYMRMLHLPFSDLPLKKWPIRIQLKSGRNPLLNWNHVFQRYKAYPDRAEKEKSGVIHARYDWTTGVHGGSSMSYLARTPYVALFCTCFCCRVIIWAKFGHLKGYYLGQVCFFNTVCRKAL